MSKTDELHKAILNNIPDQAWLKDRKSRYILTNEAFRDACGLSEKEILNKTPLDVWPGDWGQKYIDTDQEAMRLGQRVRYEEWRYGEDGTPRWFDTIKTPIRNEQGKVIGTTGISRDITDRKQAEQALLESRSQLRELSAYLQSVREEERTRISRELHDELGQSLTAIRIGLGVLEKQGQKMPDDWLKNVHALKKIADSTVESVQRIAADLRPLILDELGLPSAIDWLLESFSANAGVTYELLLPPSTLDFSREISTAIFRMLQESLTNVSRHSEATLVVVALQETNDMISLKITDNGKGIDPSVDSREKCLGLIGMRERAYMLGGNLKIQSRPGAGTSIEVRIPKLFSPIQE
jgi:two-component system sensor histidine kinase UhpB